MYGINEIRKQNANSRAEEEARKKARFSVLRDGSILLSYEGVARNIPGGKPSSEERKEADRLIKRLRDAGDNDQKIAAIIGEYYKEVDAK